MDGSGTGDGLLPTELPSDSAVGSALPVVVLLKLVELMSSAPNWPLGVNKLDSLSKLAGESIKGLPEASDAAIVTVALLPAMPPMTKAFWMI